MPNQIKKLHKILRDVRRKKKTPGQAMEQLRSFSYHNLGFAKVDKHRMLRCGFPEVVYGEGKTDQQIVEICRNLSRDNDAVLVTRVSGSTYLKLKECIKGILYDEKAHVAYRMPKKKKKKGLILVITAGTSDEPVAREAAVTAKVMGNRVRILVDVGVAGIHRLLGHSALLRKANVLIVIAGMEGALASVVGGLVSKPIVAVPTSVGYGASFKGIAPLLTMLNSCAPGVTVVNIDNGFGAGYFASLINK